MAMLLFKTAKAAKAELPIMKLMADARFRQLCSDSLFGWLNGKHPDLGDTFETLDTGEGGGTAGVCSHYTGNRSLRTAAVLDFWHPKTLWACADCIQRMGCVSMYVELVKNMYTVHSHLCLPWSMFCKAVPLHDVRQVISMWVHCSGALAHALSWVRLQRKLTHACYGIHI